MIRINLLGSAKGKTKHGSAQTAAAVMEVGEAGSPKLKVLIVLALAAAVNLGWWYRLDNQQRQIATETQKAEQINRQLADVKAHYLERQQEAENYKRRVDVIDQLRASQGSGPVDLLSMIGSTVNQTEAVWLNSMKDQGASVNIQGMALSADAVANLITNLQRTGYFKDIEIKETYQDESVKDMQAFQFTLNCEKASEPSGEKAAKTT
jgi:type IV pilus assembly protein PilN